MTQFGLQYFEARGAETAAAVKAIGCQVCRVQLFTEHDDHTLVSRERAAEIQAEVVDAGMMPYAIIRTPEQVDDLWPGVWAEFYNEPDLEEFNMPLSLFRQRLFDVIEACKDRNPLAIGGVSNLNERGLRFLRALPWDQIPEWVCCSFHWYPEDPQPHASHLKTHPIWGKRQSRDQDIEDVRAIVRRRPLVMSESGCWDNPNRSEQEVADWYAVEREFWARHVEIAVAYQLDDEKPPQNGQYEPQHGYGFRRYGSVDDWKPCARAWFGGA